MKNFINTLLVLAVLAIVAMAITNDCYVVNGKTSWIDFNRCDHSMCSTFGEETSSSPSLVKGGTVVYQPRWFGSNQTFKVVFAGSTDKGFMYELVDVKDLPKTGCLVDAFGYRMNATCAE